MSRAPRRPLDEVLVARGLAANLDDARALVATGRVLAGGAPAMSPQRSVAPSESVRVVVPRRFVSRGAAKLDGALDRFGCTVTGTFALDAGASTGGFTDCLLARGAERVLAVDVGHDQLHERLRADSRVVSLERTNVADLDPDQVRLALGRLPTIVTVDLSFTSMTRHAAHLLELCARSAQLLVLVKPQFEVDRVTASKGRGVVADPAAWRTVLERCASAILEAGGGIMGAMASPITGASGNVEFFLHASPTSVAEVDTAALDVAITAALDEASGR